MQPSGELLQLSVIENHNLTFLHIQFHFVCICPTLNGVLLGQKVLTWQIFLIYSNIRGSMVPEVVGTQTNNNEIQLV